MRLSLVFLMILWNVFLISSCKHSIKNENDSKNKITSTYKVGDFPERTAIINYAEDSIEIVQFYSDTIISTFFSSSDSAGDYFYREGIRAMDGNQLTIAIDAYETSAEFGYLMDASYSAEATCYYYLEKYDSAMIYVNKALSINPNERGALIIKDWIENKK